MKVLTHFAHGVYQTELAKIPGVKFRHVIDVDAERFHKGINPTKFWSDDTVLPSNITPIKASEVDQSKFDLMLVHWHPFIDQFRLLWQKLPLVFLEHTWPYNNLNSEIYRWKQERAKHCEHTVFITPSSKDAWGETNNPQASYIYHAIGVDDFPKKTDFTGSQIMTTTNEFISRDWACGFSLWSKVLGVPGKAYFDDIALYGYGNRNIGSISKGARTREEILDLLCNASVYFNPSIMSPVPMSLLEAAAVGTPIVSTAYCESGTIFKNGEHGIITNDSIELREGIRFILANPQKAKIMAIEARKVVKNFFDPSTFQEEWMKLFNKVIKLGRRTHETRD